MEGLSLIDVALEDDLLISSSAEQLLDPSSPGPTKDSVELFQLETTGTQEGEIKVNMSDQLNQVPERSESPRQKKAKSSNFNLRKSLAWDSAFFTGEGVLNTEELAIVNSTFKKAEASKLPEIPEERRSGESTSTLDSDSWVLENLETELFDNVRASIQKSLGKPAKAPSTAKHKVERISQNKIKLPALTRGNGVSNQRPEVTSKEPQVSRVVPRGTEESRASSRPPRILPKPTVPRLPSKATTAPVNGVNRKPLGKTANNSASSTSRSLAAPKRISSTTASSKTLPATSSVSCSISIGNSSNSPTKSPTPSNKKRSAARDVSRASSGSAINRTSIRTSRIKMTIRGQGDLTSCADLTTKCPSISPNSSIDSMVSVISEVSSTASTLAKSTNTAESFDAGSTSSSPSFRESNSRPPTMKLKSPTRISGHHATKGTASVHGASGAASGDPSKNSTNTSTQGRSFKPSGLRMPTPKIGYFDAEKSLGRNAGMLTQTLRQPTKLQNSRTATQKSGLAAELHAPKSPLSSTKVTKAASSAIGQQESKAMAMMNKGKEVRQNKLSRQSAEGGAHIKRNGKGLQVGNDDSGANPDATIQQEYAPVTTILKGEDAISSKVNLDLIFQIKHSPSRVTEQEARVNPNSIEVQVVKGHVVATDTAKENIPANIADNSNLNIQPSDLSVSAVELMSQKLSSISLLEAKDPMS